MKAKFRHFITNMAFMFRRSWELARSTYFFIVSRAVLGTIQPFALLIVPKYILDELAGQKRVDVTLRYIGLYAAVIIFFNIANLLINRFGIVQNIKTAHRVGMYNTKKWLYMDFGNFMNGQVRELAVRSIGQVDPQAFADGTVLGFFTNLFQLAGYTYIIASLHPIMIVFILIVIALNTLIGKKLNKIGYDYQPILSRFSHRYNYIFNKMVDFSVGKEVRINGASSWLKKKYDEETAEYLVKYKENQRKQSGLNILTMVIDLVQTVVIYGYCAYLAISGDITVGSFTVFLGAVTAFTGSFQGFIGRFTGIALLSKYVDDYKEFLKLSEHEGAEKEVISGAEPTGGKYDIEFVNVSFKYPNTDRYVLRNVNIKIKEGERLSIVGYNGAGKSTFIKLICRLYEPTEGKILMGGVDISTIKQSDYREMLSVVFQDYYIFTMTIRENVVMSREFDKARVVDALEKSGLGERVAMLEKGIESELWRAFDNEGVEFSGGEKQKLACARAYYKDAPVVILDEPTASLDPIAETSLYERFNSIIGDKTSIYISHRLASVKFCDSIAVFKDGELVERGTHRELMDKDGVYADMFKKQAHYYVANDPNGEVIT